MQGAADAGFAFFDLPQQSMPAVYRRLKVLGDERLRAFAKPLRTAHFLRKRIPSEPVVRALSLLGDSWLQLRDARRASDCTIAAHQGEIGPDFSGLASEVSARYRVCVARSADYLTWRYRQHYHLKYEIFTARRGTKLVAYAVVTDMDSYVDVLDLFGHDEPEVFADLLLGIAREFRSRGRPSLTLALHAPQSWAQLLTKAGFRERQAKPLIIHPFDDAGRSAATPAAAEWFLSYGDIDY